MARKKGSATTVMLSEEQLKDICAEGSLVCVPRRWLKELGFDPEQKSKAKVLTVHPDGKEIWSYRDWKAEKMAYEARVETIASEITELRKEIARAKKEGHWVEKEPKKPTPKKRMTEDEFRSYDRKLKNFFTGRYVKERLDQLLERKKERERKLREFD